MPRVELPWNCLDRVHECSYLLNLFLKTLLDIFDSSSDMPVGFIFPFDLMDELSWKFLCGFDKATCNKKTCSSCMSLNSINI